MKNENYWSRLAGFYDLPPRERRALLKQLPCHIKEDDFDEMDKGLSSECADKISENTLASFSLPFSVAPNFIIDNEATLVPMVTEEPSIVAALTKVGKIVGASGGFFTLSSPSLLKGQIHLHSMRDVDKCIAQFENHFDELVSILNVLCSGMKKYGGGLKSLSIRKISHEKMGPMLVIEPLFDVADAMGANMVNSVLEAFSPAVNKILDASIGMKILSNYCDQRVAKASCSIPYNHLAHDALGDFGRSVAEKIAYAHAFAESDKYRACTHNKGILNGIDALAIATGNDFRAIEAGAHAYASRSGSYKPLTTLHMDDDSACLKMEIEIPLCVGVVGGLSKIHQGVAVAHKLLGNFSKSAKKMQSVMASVGLAQCIGALLALSGEGIQYGHMRLHRKKLVQ